MPSVNEQILDRQVSHQIGLIRYSNSVTQKIVKHLNRVEADLIAKIIDRASRGSMTAFRQAKILDDIAAILGDASPELWSIVKTEMAELGVYETQFQTRILTSAMPAELVTAGVSIEQVRAATMSRPFQGRILKEWVSTLDAGTRLRLRDAVRIGFTEGESIDQIVRRIRGTRARNYQDGAMEISRRGAETLARTAVNHTAAQARQEVYKANSDIVKGWVFLATLDMRTTAPCWRLGTLERVYPIGQGPMPPRHPNCRSSDSVVTKSFKELGLNIKDYPESTRASMDGQVPANLTYGAWLKRQPVAVQNEVLGVKKATLFRKGDLPIDKFVDSRGNAYTLDELAMREAKAFEKAGLSE